MLFVCVLCILWVGFFWCLVWRVLVVLGWAHFVLFGSFRYFVFLAFFWNLVFFCCLGLCSFGRVVPGPLGGVAGVRLPPVFGFVGFAWVLFDFCGVLLR